MSDHGSRQQTRNVSLEASVEELRRRSEAIARLQGGSAHYIEQRALFRDYIEEKNLILEKAPSALNRAPDDEGNEHQVWFENETAS